jgi:hypothetical protein
VGGVDPINPFRKRRGGCCSSLRSTKPSALLRPSRSPARGGMRRPIRGCTSPSFGGAILRTSRSIATGAHGVDHSQGGLPLRDAGATLKLDPAAISVKLRAGPGCYGHNGADDAAADAVVIAFTGRERRSRYAGGARRITSSRCTRRW